MNQLSIRIETTPANKSYLPWITAVRRGRESSETQCFILLGCPEAELSQLPPPLQESLSELVELAIKLFAAFEYVPRDPTAVEDFFEKKLVNFENRLHSTLKEELPLHGALGVVADSRVLFTTVGDILALQITPSSIANIATSSASRPFHFDTFHSGTLNARSHLLFIPKRMGTLFKSDELKQLAFSGTSGPKMNYLEHIWNSRGLGGGALKAILLETKIKLPPTGNTTEVSIARLLDTEAKTEELLSPPLLRPVLQQFKASTQKVFAKLNCAKTYLAQIRKPPAPAAKNLEATGARPTLPPLMQYSAHAARNLRLRLEQLKRVAPPRPILRAPYALKWPAKFSRLNLEAGLTRFNALPRRSKFLLLLAAAAFFVFVQSVLFGLSRAHTRQFENTLQEETTSIRALLNEANAAAIYGNEEGAQTKITEATARIQALPTFQKELMDKLGLRPWRRFDLTLSQTALEKLRAEIEPIQAALRHLIIIETPAAVAEPALSALKLGQDSPARALYGKRLYTLRADQNQVLKHEPKADGFDAGAPWIKDGTAVENGVALTVDGSIYVLEAGGNVLEFRKGNRVNFTLKNIDPALSAPIKIWTAENSAYLYILEPSTTRLAVFSKRDGLLKVQYVSQKFTDLKDFTVDETKRTAYLLDGSSTFSIPLSHLTSR